MRAFLLKAYNQPAQLCNLHVQQPAFGEVRLRIAACGLNFADLLMLEGKYQEHPPLPMTLGMEVSGTVEALGPGVSTPSIGSRVAVFANQGGLATHGCFPAARCIPLPDDMPFTDAAAFQIAYGTSHLALDHKARLQPGETLFVTGAAGGVGLTAVEIGKRMGARVIASARGADKLALLTAAGADHVIDSTATDLRETLKSLGGFDVMYDSVGGDAFLDALRAAKPEGRLLTIGFASGTVPQIPANLLLVKNLSVMGLYWGGYLNFCPDVLTNSLTTLFNWYQAGGLKPHISHILPLEQVEDALDLLRSRKSTGKVVVTMD